MGNSVSNKYRIKAPQNLGAATKAYPRAEAIIAIGKWLNIVNAPRIRVLTFDNKKISVEHEKTLVEYARLKNKLTELENSVKERARKKAV